MTEPTISRRAAAAIRARFINEMVSDGKPVREIAEALKISQSRLHRVAKKFGIILSKPRSRRYGLWINPRNAECIDDLAAKAGVSPSAMIGRIVSAVVDDGAPSAERFLGKKALPQRPYTKGGGNA